MGQEPIPIPAWEKIFVKMGGPDGTVDKEQLIRQVTFLQKMINDGPPGVPTEEPTALVELDFDVEEFLDMTPEDIADKVLDQFDKDGEAGLQSDEMLNLVNYVRDKMGAGPIPDEVWPKVFADMGGNDGTIDKAELTTQMKGL